MAAGDLFRALKGVQNFGPATEKVEDAVYYRGYKDALSELGGKFEAADDQLGGSVRETNPGFGMMPMGTLSPQKDAGWTNSGDPLGLFKGNLGTQQENPMMDMPDLQNLRLGSEKKLDLNSALDAISGFGGNAVGAPHMGNYTDDYMQRVKLGIDLLNNRLGTMQDQDQFMTEQKGKSSSGRSSKSSKKNLTNVPDGTIVIDDDGNVVFENKKDSKPGHINVPDGTDVLDDTFKLRYQNKKDKKNSAGGSGGGKNDNEEEYTVPKEAIQSLGRIIYDPQQRKRKDIKVKNQRYWDEAKGHFFKSTTRVKELVDNAEKTYGILSPEDLAKALSVPMTDKEAAAAEAFINFYGETAYQSMQKLPPKYFWEQ